MSSLYDIDFDSVASQMLPPDKRFKFQLKWVRALLSPLTYLADAVFQDFRLGASFAIWVNGNAYPKKSKVIYGTSVYESLYDGNVTVPTNASNWRVCQLDFVGVDTRMKYSGSKLVLEFALNKRFQTVFRQPPAVSDIYIEANPPAPKTFLIGESAIESSKVYSNTSSEFINNTYDYLASANATVYVPLTAFEAISADAGAREKIVRGYVDKYLPAGITYSIQTY